MKSMQKASICLFIMVLVMLVLPDESPAPGGSGWLPSWTQQLGFQPDTEPEAGEIVSSVTGKVTQPGKLSGLGLQSEAGDRIKLIAIDGGWRITNLTNGNAANVRIKGDKLVTF